MGKAVISLSRSISLSKQIFSVKLKLKEKKDDVWLLFSPKNNHHGQAAP